MLLNQPHATALNLAIFWKKKRGGSRHAQTTKGGWRIFSRLVRFQSAAVTAITAGRKAPFTDQTLSSIIIS